MLGPRARGQTGQFWPPGRPNRPSNREWARAAIGAVAQPVALVAWPQAESDAGRRQAASCNNADVPIRANKWRVCKLSPLSSPNSSLLRRAARRGPKWNRDQRRRPCSRPNHALDFCAEPSLNSTNQSRGADWGKSRVASRQRSAPPPPARRDKRTTQANENEIAPAAGGELRGPATGHNCSSACFQLPCERINYEPRGLGP